MSLVKFRAMVQDTSCSPEMYLSSLSESACGGWGLDSLVELPAGNFDLRSNSNVLKERDVVWAVSVPGQGHWCDRSGNDGDSSASGTLGPDSACSASDKSVSLPDSKIKTSLLTGKQCQGSRSYKPYKYPIPGSNHIAVQLKVVPVQYFTWSFAVI